MSDIDMNSSHPSILVDLSRARLHEIPKTLHQIVTQRVQTRTDIASYYGTNDTNFAKSLILAITYGATLQNKTNHKKYNIMTTKHPPSFPPHGIIRKYHEEIKMLIETLINTDEGEPDRNAA